MSPCCQLCEAFRNLTLQQLVMWERPCVTGGVVGVIAAMLVCFGYFEYTLITFMCRLLEAVFVAVGVAVYQKWVDISADEVKRRVRLLISEAEPYVISGVEQLFRIVSWEDPIFSLKVFIASFFLSFVGNVFSDLCFVLVATICVFVIPVGYTLNKGYIDPQIGRASQVFTGLINNIKLKSN